MNHDVIVDKYARLYEIPTQLAFLGQDVIAYCLSYRGGGNYSSAVQKTGQGSICWKSTSIGIFKPWSFISYIKQLVHVCKQNDIQVIYSSSDMLHIVIAHVLSVICRKPFSVVGWLAF